MQYLQRTLQIREELIRNDSLLNRMREVFTSHYGETHHISPTYTGDMRLVYFIGTVNLPEGTPRLLLKLARCDRGEEDFNLDGASFVDQETIGLNWLLTEVGTFDLYFDYLSGAISTLVFNDEDYVRYTKRRRPVLNRTNRDASNLLPQEVNIKRDARLKVCPGDLGAVPYFQLVVRWQNRLGLLTEGLPSLITPRTCWTTPEDHVMEDGRIIDLYPPWKSALVGELQWTDDHGSKDYLGILGRGRQYLRPENRLNL